jgi:dienelactone hydrolase
MSGSASDTSKSAWTPAPIHTSWDDLLDEVETPEAWMEKRQGVKDRFFTLRKDEAAPVPPLDFHIRVEREWDGGGFRIQYISYQVESDERAHAYLGIPSGPIPERGFPGVVCLHGTTNWGARRTLGLPPEPGDPHGQAKAVDGKDYARQLVRHGYVTISPEHFCSAARLPKEGPYETGAFYRRHPHWSAVGKYVYDSRIACSVLAARPDVDANRLGATGHSLGGHGSIWLSASDDRIQCAAPSCSGLSFRENPNPLQWSRDHWYVYFPQLREEFLAGRQIPCDFHEMMSLIAPRPLLERFALNDGDSGSQAHRAQLHLKLRELYRLLDAEPAHAFLIFGDGHAIPDVSNVCMLSWMDRWLKFDGDPLGAWDNRPTPTA